MLLLCGDIMKSFSNFHFVPPTSVVYTMESGAFETIKGDIKQGVCLPQIKFSVSFLYNDNDASIIREVSKVEAATINWKEVEKVFKEKRELFSYKEMLQKPVTDILLAIGILEIKTNPDVLINGEPEQYFEIKEEYRMEYDDSRPIEEIIYPNL